MVRVDAGMTLMLMGGVQDKFDKLNASARQPGRRGGSRPRNDIRRRHRRHRSAPG